MYQLVAPPGLCDSTPPTSEVTDDGSHAHLRLHEARLRGTERPARHESPPCLQHPVCHPMGCKPPAPSLLGHQTVLAYKHAPLGSSLVHKAGLLSTR